MFGYSWIDSTRFSPRDRKFFRLYFLENRHRDDVCRLMGIGTAQFYNYQNKIFSRLDRDFKRYKTRNPHFKTPEFMLMDLEQEEVSKEDAVEAVTIQLLQQEYEKQIGKVPNRYKNDKQRLLSKLKSND